MQVSNKDRVARALARSRSLKARDAALTERAQQLRREFDDLEAEKNALKARRRGASAELAAA